MIRARSGVGSIRKTAEEFNLNEVPVATIAGPENEHAWIRSNVSRDVAQ
jgi:hypothetical protein